ncbi:hypothetical protein MJH12_09705 [bacterium]|nr:hypothetical protein [bacterium]
MYKTAIYQVKLKKIDGESVLKAKVLSCRKPQKAIFGYSIKCMTRILGLCDSIWEKEIKVKLTAQEYGHLINK